ncbi:MAG: type IV secretory system conjugative DNA transfer family protein [Phycisphaerales bacterium]|nr:type IV secretory system conjugative DNA transfer family protein [Phycisphaerales bacterium]
MSRRRKSSSTPLGLVVNGDVWVLAEAMTTDAYGGTLAELAVRLNDTRASENEWTGTINTAIQSLEIFDDFGPLGRSTAVKDGFDFGTLKTGRPTTVYVTLPPEYMLSHGAWLNLVLTAAVEQMSRVEPHRKVLLLLDEFASTGLAMPAIFKVIGIGRKYGLVPVLYLQSISQITRIYGEPATRELLAMCELVVGCGVRDRETCRWFSELSGSQTVSQTNHSIRPDVLGGGASQDYSSSRSVQGRPLIFPEQVRELRGDRALVFFKNAPPLQVNTTPYFRNPRLRRHAAPNPYYRET